LTGRYLQRMAARADRGDPLLPEISPSFLLQAKAFFCMNEHLTNGKLNGKRVDYDVRVELPYNDYPAA
jgi:hypothetical protein